MIKSAEANGKVMVTFELHPAVGAGQAAVCGDWNDWSTRADLMARDAEGGFRLAVELDAGRAYRFRYFLDDCRWENDWAADAYIGNHFGGEDSIVDLTAIDRTPKPAKRARKTSSPRKAT